MKISGRTLGAAIVSTLVIGAFVIPRLAAAADQSSSARPGPSPLSKDTLKELQGICGFCAKEGDNCYNFKPLLSKPSPDPGNGCSFPPCSPTGMSDGGNTGGDSEKKLACLGCRAICPRFTASEKPKQQPEKQQAQ